MVNCDRCCICQYGSESQQACVVMRPGGLELTGRAADISNLSSGARMVDIACGRGASLRWLVSDCKMKVIGIDISLKQLQAGAEFCGNAPFVQSTASLLPIRSQSIDAVLIECALSLVGETKNTLLESRRVLKPGGKLIVSDIYAPGPVTKTPGLELDPACCLARVRSQDAIIEEIESNGFKLLVWEDHSPALKKWLVNLIFTMGSADGFYRQIFNAPDGVTNLKEKFAGLKLGYYLQVAQRI